MPPAWLHTAVEYKAERLGAAEGVEVRLGPTFVAAWNQAEVDEEVPTDAYSTWAFLLSTTHARGGLAITPVLGIDNLFDVAYVDPLSRFRPYGGLAPGRSVRVGF